ncbi:Signal transduction histidine kinase [Pseudobutyrivibrio sp. ACV-2]|nr:Signal transduction histidine kinase [Pseudobutyrivibrio sp. ACV-2]
MDKNKKNFVVKLFTPDNKMSLIIAWVIYLLLTLIFCHIVSAHSANYYISDNGHVVAGYYLLPILFLAGLYGYIIAFISFSAAFVCSLLFNMGDTYTMVIYMGIIVCFAIIGRYEWYISFWKTIILCSITFVTVTGMSYLCVHAVATMNYEAHNIFASTYHSYKEILAIYGVGLFLHFFYKFAPDNVKKVFPIGIVYTEAVKNDENIKKKLRMTKVSIKLTGTIFSIEIVLIIFVAVFMMVLFPDMKKIFTHRDDIQNEVTGELLNLKRIDELDFVVDGAMISFDLKMICLMFCVGAPLAAFSSFYTKYFIAAPLGEMADFLEEYAYTSDEDKILYGHKIDDIAITSKDEIETVYNALHATVYEMEAYIGRMKAEQKLKSELEIAKRSNEAKSSFLSNMSHEIRTPINAVIGMNEMILRESKEPQILVYANNAKSASNSLLSLINDILDFSKIEAGKMEIILAQYQMGSTINDLINMVATRAEEKGLRFDINVDEHIPCLLIGDELRIKQCVTNLLTNAVKYTEKGAISLDVSFEPINDRSIFLKFSVSDTGIGIKEEDLSKLYSPFERIEEIRNRTIEGTGLGMSIVRKLLALMDTKMEVKSEYGKGSTFSFAIKQQVVSWEEIGNFIEKYKDFINSANDYHRRFSAPDARILVVDDTEMNLTVVKSLLKQTNVQIDTAGSGLETLEKVKNNSYDVIFLDHRMPNMDGIETFEAMKVLEGNRNQNIPVIALTANAVSGAKEEYVAHGFSDYLSKPIDGSELEKMLEYYLPKEKIISVSVEKDSEEYVPDFNMEIPTDSFLNELKDVDLKEAVKNCGGVDVLEKVVVDFYSSIDGKVEAIEGFLKEQDIRNYTVLVHALKSSARLVGAMELSDMAAELEQLGNEEKLEFIREKNPGLIARYLSYKDSLSACVKENEVLPEISVDVLKDAYRDIKELVEAYDFDTAESIMNMLKEYSIPAEVKENHEKLEKLMREVDRDGVLNLL